MGLDYRFFGKLFLEPPEKLLSINDLERLRDLEPLLRRLEERQAVAEYDYEKEFSDFQGRELSAWRELGVERPKEFLLIASGDPRSLTACHLYNPTFSSADPWIRETYDISNQSIHQLSELGLNPSNCLFFDHFCRRDTSEDVQSAYPDSIRRIHEEFILSFRRNIGFKIEICWGKRVKERMKELLTLIPIRLWGRYQDVTIHLEMDTMTSEIRRLLVFVHHPEYFFRIGLTSSYANHFRSTVSRRQDLFILVAAKLGGIGIQENFYEKYYRNSKRPKLTVDQNQQRLMLEDCAVSQLKVATPEIFKEREIASSALIEESKELGLAVGLQKDLVNHSEQINSIRNDEWHLPVLETMRASLNLAIAEMNAEANSISDSKLISPLQRTSWDGISEWEELPTLLTDWVQSQDGLKIGQNPISSIDELIRAYLFLRCKGNPYVQGSVAILHRVAVKYLWTVFKERNEKIEGLIIPGEPPRHIIARKCSRCQRKVLNDAFAHYARLDPRYYVTWNRERGCGLPNCNQGRIILIPADPHQLFRRNLTATLTFFKSAPWEEYFIRGFTDELPSASVTIRCPKCRAQPQNDDHPRWTTERNPRYIPRQLKCGICYYNGLWEPTDAAIRTITLAALSKKWKDFKEKGLDLTKYPRCCEVYWSKSYIQTKIEQLEKLKREMEMLKGQP